MIDQCIYEVYKRDERVIIPNFGAIIYTDYTDEADFNSLLNFDDGKVVAEIQKQQSLTEEKANQVLEQYVEEINKKIEKGTPVFIGGIGYLVKDDAGHILIEKVKPSSEATPSEKSKKDGSKTKRKSKAKDETKNKAKEEEIDEVAKDTSDQSDTFEEQNPPETEENHEDQRSLLESEDDEVHIGNTFIHGEEIELERDDGDEFDAENDLVYDDEPKKGNGLKIALLVIIPLLLVAAGIYYYFNFYGKEDEKSTLATTTTSTDASTETPEEQETELVKKQDTVEEKEVVKEPVSENAPSVSTTEEANLASVKYEMTEKTSSSSQSTSIEGDGKYYSLILGSFKVESNADDFQQRLRSKGMNVNKFLGKNNFYFVGFENIEGKSEAIRRLSEIKQENPSAWVINKNLIRL